MIHYRSIAFLHFTTKVIGFSQFVEEFITNEILSITKTKSIINEFQ